MAEKKYLKFRAPYIYSTFNKVHDLILGANGVLFGMDVEDAGGGDILIKKGAFVVKGLIIEVDEDVLFTPTSGIVPLYLLASTSSVHESDPIVWTTTSELSEISENSTLISMYNGSEWVSSEKISLNSIVRSSHTHNKYVNGKGVYSGYDARINDLFNTLELPSGYLIDGVGTKYETTETVNFPVGDLDPDFPRRDVIVYRRPLDDYRKPGILEKVVGPTYSLNEFSRFENVRENQVSSTTPSIPHEKPQTIVDSDNNLHVFWITSNNLYYSKWNSTRTVAHIPEINLEIGWESFQAIIDRNDKIHLTGIISNKVVYKRFKKEGVSDIATRVVSSQPNEISSPSIAIDNIGECYIMYTHVEELSGVPSLNRQIYFVKLNQDGSTGISPKKVTLDLFDYSELKIAIDENRSLHVAALNDINDRVYYGLFDKTGAVVTSMMDIADDTGGNFGSGEYTPFGLTACTSPVIHLSDIGDIYVAWTQERIYPSYSAKSLVLYHPRFKAVNGFKALALGMDNQNLGFGEHGYGVRGYGRDLVDRAGRILDDEDVANPTITIDGYRNIILAVDGRLDPTDAHSIWAVKMTNNTFNHERRLTQLGPFQLKHTFEYVDTFTHPHITMDKTGCITTVWVDKTTDDIFFNKSTASVFIEGFVESDIELWITEASYPAESITKLDDLSVTNRNKNTLADRVKKVTVGVSETSGDFVGDHGIKEALEYLKNFGGVIEIQGGTYVVGNSYEIYSGIQIKTLGKVYFEKKGGIGPIFTMSGKKSSISSKTDYTFTDLNTDFRANGFLIGDVVDLLDSTGTFLQRTRISAINGSGGTGGLINITIHTRDEITPLAEKYIVYRGGASIESCNFLHNEIASHITMNYVHHCKVLNTAIENAYAHGISITNAMNSSINGCSIRNNRGRGILVNQSEQGGVHVSNNVLNGNAYVTDFYDIEFTSTTKDNLVHMNKGNLLDSGTNNQPPQKDLTSISQVAFDDFIADAKIKNAEGSNYLDSNPYNLNVDKNGDVVTGLTFIPVGELVFDSELGLYSCGKNKEVMVSVDGYWKNKIDSSSKIPYISSIGAEAKIKITYYGTGIIVLAKTGSAQCDNLIVSIDGANDSLSFLSNRGNLDDGFSKKLLYNEQELGIHHLTIKRVDSDYTKEFALAGFYIVNSDTFSGGSIQARVNTGNAYINGKLYSHLEKLFSCADNVSRCDSVSFSTTSDYTHSLGTVLSDGGEEYLSSISVSRVLEEISTRENSKAPEIYSVSELTHFDIDGEDFIKGVHNDKTILVWGSSSGIYSGVKKDITSFERESLRIETADSELNMIVKGTGLDIEVGVHPGLDSESIQVYVDGILRGVITIPSVTKDIDSVVIPIFSKLQDCSHHVRFVSASGNTQPCLYLQGFSIYCPKKPLLGSGKKRIANFRNSNGYISYSLDSGAVFEGAWEELSYDYNRGTASRLRLEGGQGQLRIYYQGAGFEITFDDLPDSSDFTIKVDTYDPSDIAMNGYGYNRRAGEENLSYGFHEIVITPTESGKYLYPNFYSIKEQIIGLHKQKNISPVGSDIKKIICN